MVIIILYNSKNTSMRYCKKLYFDVTYHFGCKKFNSAPFLLKIGANEAYLQGVSVAFFEPVATGFYWSSSKRFFIGFLFQEDRTATSPVRFFQFGSVRSGFDLFPVHRTGPSNPIHCRIHSFHHHRGEW